MEIHTHMNTQYLCLLHKRTKPLSNRQPPPSCTRSAPTASIWLCAPWATGPRALSPHTSPTGVYMPMCSICLCVYVGSFVGSFVYLALQVWSVFRRFHTKSGRIPPTLVLHKNSIHGQQHISLEQHGRAPLLRARVRRRGLPLFFGAGRLDGRSAPAADVDGLRCVFCVSAKRMIRGGGLVMHGRHKK